MKRYQGRIRASIVVQDQAKELRRQETPAEQILWQALRGRQLAGFKFRRQHPLGRYIVDFCCPERQLIVELDGGIHDTRIIEDTQRTQGLETWGYRLLRFRNEQIQEHLTEVLGEIRRAVETISNRNL